MNMTRAVDTSIQAVSPVSIFGTSTSVLPVDGPVDGSPEDATVCTGSRFRYRFAVVSAGLIPAGCEECVFRGDGWRSFPERPVTFRERGGQLEAGAGAGGKNSY